MLNLRQQLAQSHAVASQLIRHDHAWHVIEALQQSSKEAFGCLGIPPLLNEDVENEAVLIHGTPRIVLHALDPDEHLVQVPLVSGSWAAASQKGCEGLAKLLAPPTNCLMRDDNAVALPRNCLPSIATCPAARTPYSFQAGDINGLKQFTSYRRCRNPAAADPDAGQRLSAQPFAPPNDTQLVPAAAQERRYRDQLHKR